MAHKTRLSFVCQTGMNPDKTHLASNVFGVVSKSGGKFKTRGAANRETATYDVLNVVALDTCQCHGSRFLISVRYRIPQAGLQWKSFRLPRGSHSWKFTA